MASSESTLAWTSPAAGCFVRPLDTLETFMVLTDSGAAIGREHWAISISLRLAFPTNLSAADATLHLQRAWLIVCRLHPALTGSIAPASSPTATPTLMVPPLHTDEEKASWLSRSFFTQQSDQPGARSDDLFTTLRRTGTPTCHWLPASRELHIRSQHWRIDGIGILMLTDSFMTALASVVRLGINADLETYAPGISVHSAGLTPSLDGLGLSYLDEATTPAHIGDAADALVADFVQGIPSIALPTIPGSEDAVPGDTARVAITLDALETAAVIAACKFCGINVSSAVHAALVRVTATYPQHPLANSYAIFLPVDVRRHLPSSPKSAELFVNVLSSGLPIRIPGVLGKSFDEVAKEMGAAYDSDLARHRPSDVEPIVTMPKLMAPYIRRTTKLFLTPPPPELPPMQTPGLSSLGKVEQHIKRDYACGADESDRITVEDFWLGTQMASRQLQFHVWTFRDQMTIQGCRNVMFYEKEFVADVLDKLKAELLLGLGVA